MCAQRCILCVQICLVCAQRCLVYAQRCMNHKPPSLTQVPINCKLSSKESFILLKMCLFLCYVYGCFDYIYFCASYVLFPQARILGAGVTECFSCHVGAENLLEEQSVLLTSEPFLQPLIHTYFCHIQNGIEHSLFAPITC